MRSLRGFRCWAYLAVCTCALVVFWELAVVVRSPLDETAAAPLHRLPRMVVALLEDPWVLSRQADEHPEEEQRPQRGLARCALWFTDHPACLGAATVKECLNVHGIAAWLPYVPHGCPLKEFAAAVGVDDRSGQRHPIQRRVFLGDAVLASTRPCASKRRKYVPPQQRRFATSALMSRRFRCPPSDHHGSSVPKRRRATVIAYATGYFIPESNIRDPVPETVGGPLWDWSVVLPSIYPVASHHVTSDEGEGGRNQDAAPRSSSVLYPRNEFMFSDADEMWYALSLRYSRFSWTLRRTGENTQRTMEILASGGVPFYPELERCSDNSRGGCLWQLPLDLLANVRQMPGVRHIEHPVRPVEESDQVIRAVLRLLDAEEDDDAAAANSTSAGNHRELLLRPVCLIMASSAQRTTFTDEQPAMMMLGGGQGGGGGGGGGALCPSPNATPFNRYLFYRLGQLNVKRTGTIDWWGSSGGAFGVQQNRFDADAHRRVARQLLRFTKQHLTCGAGMASILRSIGYEEPRRVLHLVHHEDVTTGNNGVCGLAELGIRYARNVEHGIEHWTAQEEAEEEGTHPECTTPSWKEADGTRHRGPPHNLTRQGAGWTFEAFAHWKKSVVSGAYAHGYFYAHRHPPPPLPYVALNASTPHDVCLIALQGFDMVVFGGLVPRPSRIPCYRAVVELLLHHSNSKESHPSRRGALQRFVVIDESDQPVAVDGSYAELVHDGGAHVFAVNPPKGCTVEGAK